MTAFGCKIDLIGDKYEVINLDTYSAIGWIVKNKGLYEFTSLPEAQRFSAHEVMAIAHFILELQAKDLGL